MSSISNTLVIPGHSIPAHAIFHESELKQYYRWQRSYTTYKPHDLGNIPTATEYHDFRQWQMRQDSGYFSDPFEDIANHLQPGLSEKAKVEPSAFASRVCQHNLHPALMGKVQTRCPACTVNAHLDYMTYLTRILEDVEGRSWAQARSRSTRRGLLHGAWRSAKLATMQELSTLEWLMEEEIQWESERSDVRLQGIQTAADAIDLYWSKTTGRGPRISRPNGQRKVHFTGELNYQPSRPQPFYCTRSPRYTPGKYAAATDTEDVHQNHIEDGHETQALDSGLQDAPGSSALANGSTDDLSVDDMSLVESLRLRGDQLHVDHEPGNGVGGCCGDEDDGIFDDEDEDELESGDSEDDMDHGWQGSLDSDIACDFIVFADD